MSALHRDTIFALSSGLPPAGLAVFRISGAEAGRVLETLGGALSPARRASLRTIRDPIGGDVIDHGLVLWFPGPGSATGEDLAEIHLHGGRAVVAAMLEVLGHQPGCREAEAGEFTRRAFENGRIDLPQAEGLADLIEAETEAQRRAALALSEGELGRLVGGWRDRLLTVSALVEAELDFSDEDDVSNNGTYVHLLEGLAKDLSAWMARPGAERLRDGIRVVVAGPPNAGKSSLVNALAGREAAIVADLPGTTRDRIEVPLTVAGVPMILIDTAGLRDSGDRVEALGIERARSSLAEADIVLWLGAADELPERALLVLSKADICTGPGMPVSAKTGAGVAALLETLGREAAKRLPAPGSIALNARHRVALASAFEELRLATDQPDILLVAEHLRHARDALDRITGRSDTETMLDALFGRLCIGK